MRFFHPIVGFYERFERRISSFSLLLGFIFDALTLKRADALWENFVISSYLVVIGVCIILIHLKESENNSEKNINSAHFWYVNILQFAFGGLFSAFLILYFHSADIWVAWPFIALLVFALVGNEFFKKHYARLGFQISMFFLAIFWFMIFLIPVILQKIGVGIFLLSGFLSLIIISVFIKILFYFTKEKFITKKRFLTGLVVLVFMSVNFLYFTNLIPPIPLSLKNGGIYHSVTKTREGNYVVFYEDHGWRGYFKFYPEFQKAPGASVYAWSAVFSPKGLDLIIRHEWQYYDQARKRWVTKSIIDLPVSGGRDGGFRTYSMSSSITAGKWRVNIKTAQGQIIGRLRFAVVSADTRPELSSAIR